jgi:hypothetical protein
VATHSKSAEPEISPAPPADPEQAPSFTVGHDGKIDGIYRPRDHRRAWTDNDKARFELAGQEKRRDPAPAQRPARIRTPVSPGKILIALGILGAVIAVPLAARWGLQRWNDYQLRSAKPSGLIIIDSVPSLARVFIDGKEVGRTPYLAPNLFQPGSTVPVRIVYPGAQEWVGTIPGGVEAGFTAELQPQQ